MDKHQPATPLPWRFSAKESTVYGGTDEVVCDSEMYYPAAVADGDQAYIAHSANAYPKLVEALREWTRPGHFSLQDDVEEAIKRHAALLREIGELK